MNTNKKTKQSRPTRHAGNCQRLFRSSWFGRLTTSDSDHSRNQSVETAYSSAPRLFLGFEPLRRIRSRASATLLLCSLPFLAPAVAVANLAEWNLAGQPGNQLSTSGVSASADITVNDVARGPEVSPTSANNSISANGWDAGGNDRYFTFGFTVAAGFQANLGQLIIGTRSSNTGPGSLGLFTSVDGFAAPIHTFTQSGSNFLNSTVDLSSLSGLTDTVEFRIIPLSTVSANGGTISSGGTYRITNFFDGGDTGSFRITGTVEAGGDPVDPTVPTLSTPTFSDTSENSAVASVSFVANDAADFTTYGFLIARTSDNPSPSFGDLNADNIDFDTLPVPANITTEFFGLDADTEYSVRAYVIYASGAETILSNVNTFTTDAPFVPPVVPAIDGITDYTQDFSGFVSDETLPDGWSITADGNNNYQGEWGTGTTNGWRGNANVLGFQHSGSSGTADKTLTLENTTGGEITELFISYEGRVERAIEGRNPIYTVTVDGVTVATLSYDTNEGDAVTKASVASGLNIPDGANFEIVWTSERGGTTGSSKQIGISNVQVSLDLPSDIAPTLLNITFPDPVEFPVTATGFSVDSGLLDAGSDPVTAVGFVIAETALQANPAVGDANTTVIDLTTTFDPDFSLIFYDFAGLTPGTSYSVRSFATSAAGTSYSAAITQATLSLPASLTAAGYDEDFLGFTGVESLPAGWSVVGASTGYGGDWGAGSAGGFRGPEDGATVGVIGYQHTGSTGILTISLEMTNDTGAEINALEISYLGRVERVDQTRLPIWTVEVDGVEVPALSYSTGAGVDQTVSTTVTGLSIASGATFTISWSSDRGESAGASRQIGLADVAVDAVSVDVTPPALDLASGTYFEDQTVFVSNFASLGASVEVRYTLDGSDPAAGVGSLYDDGTGILIEDGNGAVQLRAISVDTTDSSVSPIVPATYTFPINVADIAALRASSTGGLYRVTGEITYTGGDSFRGTKFFQDTSGFGIQIDDNSSVISTTYAVGDNIAGFVGTLGAFRNQLQWVPAFDPGAPVSTDNSVTPVVRTLDTLSSDDQALLVRINGVEFESAGDFFGTGGQGTNITDPSVTGFVGRYRNNFGDSDITGAEIPTGVVDLIAIVQQRDADFNVAARSLDDIEVSTPPSGNPLGDYLTQRSLSLSDLETDTNGNGFTVIEEYFAGFGDGAGGDTIVYGIDPAGPALTLTSDLASDPDGVVVALLATSDLTTAFASVAFTVSSVDNGDGTFTRTYTETNPPAEADTRFYQLSITIEVE